MFEKGVKSTNDNKKEKKGASKGHKKKKIKYENKSTNNVLEGRKSMGKFNKGASTNLYYMISDCVFGVLAFVLAAIGSRLYIDAFRKGYIIISIAFMVVYILSSKEARRYNVTTFFYVDRCCKKVTNSYFIAIAVVGMVLYFDDGKNLSRSFLGLFIAFSYCLMLVSAFTMRYWIKSGKINTERTILIGSKEKYTKFEYFLGKSSMEVDVIGYVSLGELKEDEKEQYLGTVDELEKILHENAADQIYIMVKEQKDISEIQRYINMCNDMGLTARVILDSFEPGNAQSYVSAVGTYPVVTYHTVTLNASSKALKRLVDIIGSIVGIILFSPIMLITAIAIKLDSPGPVLFKQVRVGLNGRKFNIYKFRSMCNNAEAMKRKLMDQNEMGDGFMFKIQDDPRVTKVGKFIRKTSIDELPQFFNVLIGNMSLVGTRPPTVDEVDKYERNHWRRISIKPGITGLWQVSGRSSITDFGQIVELDTRYIDDWNVFMDLKIMIQTVFMVIRRKGAY